MEARVHSRVFFGKGGWRNSKPHKLESLNRDQGLRLGFGLFLDSRHDIQRGVRRDIPKSTSLTMVFPKQSTSENGRYKMGKWVSLVVVSRKPVIVGGNI